MLSLSSLSAATYYVNSGTGSDSNPGTAAAPWRTFYGSVPKLVAGDTMIVTGTFAENPGSGSSYNFAISGTAANPITIRGNNATFQIVGGRMGGLTYRFDGDYVILDGFKITGSNVNHSGWASFFGNRCTMMNCEFYNLNGAAAYSDDVLACVVIDGDYNVCTNLTFRDIRDGDLFRLWGRGNRISSCLVTNVTNPLYSSSTPKHADFVQHFGGGYCLSNVVENCLFINNSFAQCQLNGYDAPNPVEKAYCVYRNNILYNNRGYFTITHIPNMAFYNNIFYDCEQVLPYDLAVNTKFFNNVFIDTPAAGGSGIGRNPSGIQKDYNAWNELARSTSPGLMTGYGPSNIVVTDPGFVNVAAADFRLKASSPLRGRGINLYNDPLASTVDKNGQRRPASGPWDIGPYQYDSGLATNPVIQLSAGALTFGSVLAGQSATNTITLRNAGAGTLSGSASVSAPFYIVSGGSYTLSSNQSQTVTVRYSPTVAGESVGTITFSGGGGALASVSGSASSVQSGLTFSASAGTVSGPFVVNGDVVQQNTNTGLEGGGRAVYAFNITKPGDYILSIMATAPSDAANSFYVNIDSEPTDPLMIWDIRPATTMAARVVSWRGAGSDVTPEFSPKVFSLSAGTHQLIVRGREAGAQLGEISVLSYSGTHGDPPRRLRIASN